MGLRRPGLLGSSDGSEVLRNRGRKMRALKRAVDTNLMNFKTFKQWAESCVPPEKSNRRKARFQCFCEGREGVGSTLPGFIAPPGMQGGVGIGFPVSP